MDVKMVKWVDAEKLIRHLEDEVEGCQSAYSAGTSETRKSIAYGTMLGLKSAISFAQTLSTVADTTGRVMVCLDDVKQAIKDYAKAAVDAGRESLDPVDDMVELLNIVEKIVGGET